MKRTFARRRLMLVALVVYSSALVLKATALDPEGLLLVHDSVGIVACL